MRTRASVWRWRVGFTVVLLAGVAALGYAEVSGEAADRHKVRGTFTSNGCIDLGRYGRSGHRYDCIGTFHSQDGRVDSIVSLTSSGHDLEKGERVGALVDGAQSREATAADESVWRRWVTIGLGAILLVLLAAMWVSVLRADRGVPPRRGGKGYVPMNPGQQS